MKTKKILQRVISAKTHNLGNLHPVMKRIYLARGIKNFSEIDNNKTNLLSYEKLKNIKLAAKIIVDSIVAKQKIVIVGDYDADGATSTVLAMKLLKAFGCSNVSYYVPNRIEDGYGLTGKIVDLAAKDNPHLLITVDNGISSIEGVEKAKEYGMKVIITDHHLPGQNLPNADAIINPNLADDLFGSKNLAGVGVVFYLMSAVRAYLAEFDWFNQENIPVPKLINYLDLVALGTIADVVPLDQNNRTLVKLGIDIIRQGKGNHGIRAICMMAQRNPTKIIATDLGFSIGPRLNAAGRLDDMSIGIECLLADDFEDAHYLASNLDKLNVERRQIEAKAREEAVKELDIEIDLEEIPYGICIYNDNWHEGVIGLVASRIKEFYHRPTVVFTKSEDKLLKGSARSIPGIHIKNVFDKMVSEDSSLIQKFGGHAMAAGLSIAKDKFTKFKEMFEKIINQDATPDLFEDVIFSDGKLNYEDFNIELASEILNGGPWGQEFSEPIFDGVFKVKDAYLIKDKHLKMNLEIHDGIFSSILFNYGKEDIESLVGSSIHAVYRLDINDYYDENRIQLKLQQFTPSENSK